MTLEDRIKALELSVYLLENRVAKIEGKCIRCDMAWEKGLASWVITSSGMVCPKCIVPTDMRSDQSIIDIDSSVYQQFVDSQCETGVDKWLNGLTLGTVFKKWAALSISGCNLSSKDLLPFEQWMASRFAFSINDDGFARYYGIRIKNHSEMSPSKAGDVPELNDDAYQQFVDERCEIGVDEWCREHRLSSAFWKWVSVRIPFYNLSAPDYDAFHAWLRLNFEAKQTPYGVDYHGISVLPRNAARARA